MIPCYGFANWQASVNMLLQICICDVALLSNAAIQIYSDRHVGLSLCGQHVIATATKYLVHLPVH